MVMLTGMMVMADIGALGNHRNRNGQSGGMIILVPLADSLDQDADKHHKKQTKHQEKHDLKQIKTKSETEHLFHPLIKRYAILYHFLRRKSTTSKSQTDNCI